ncbi:hypothetical protein Tco_0961291 [Tanacetum coccineum]
MNLLHKVHKGELMVDYDWDQADDHLEGIWIGLAKLLKYEYGTTTYTGQLYAYLTMAFRPGVIVVPGPPIPKNPSLEGYT